LTRYEQYTTTIDGVEIHFLHVRSPAPGATPCIITHGWPGSVVEFVKVSEPLVDPVAHGAEPSDALELVIPSLPGYGWSGKPTVTGWTVEKIAQAWIELMDRLGYERWVAQGGDWGALVSQAIGRLADPATLIGIHVNWALADAAKLRGRGRLRDRAGDQAADPRIRPDRLTGRPARLDRREVRHRARTLAFPRTTSPFQSAGRGPASPICATTAPLRAAATSPPTKPPPSSPPKSASVSAPSQKCQFDA
jgi:pimeloyl-ACP methyl ester carboxylesterase